MFETVYSLSGEPPSLDAATDDTDPAVLQRGRLAGGSVSSICFIRRIAAGGAVLHADMPLDEGRRLELELETGEHLDGTIVWRRGCEVGLRFDAPIDLLPILARNLVSQPGERRRMPRVEVGCPALIEAGDRHGLTTVIDIAQGGAKIAPPFALEPEERVVLTPEGLRPLAAKVRWVRGALAGLAFRPELDWQELMPWLAQRRGAASAEFPSAAPALGPPEPPPPASEGGIQLNLPARVREGTRRWGIEVAGLTARTVEFECFAAIPLGTLLWIALPGLEGWPARIVGIDGYRFTCEFTQPLHPAVLERILALARDRR